MSIIPKSVHVERLEQNIDIWDFSLTDEEMAKIAGKDLGHSEIVNHDNPAFVKFVPNLHKGAQDTVSTWHEEIRSMITPRVRSRELVGKPGFRCLSAFDPLWQIILSPA